MRQAPAVSGVENVDRGAHGGRRADERRMAARRRNGRAHAAAPASSDGGNAAQIEPAGPVIKNFGLAPFDERIGRLRRRATAPSRCARRRARPLARWRRTASTSRIARHSAREGASPSASSAPNGAAVFSSTLLRCATDGATPSSRKAVTAPSAAAVSAIRAAICAGKCAAAETSAERAHGRRHDFARRRIVEAEHQDGRPRSRRAAAS